MPWPRPKRWQEQSNAHNPVTKWNLNRQLCKGLVFPSLLPLLWWRFLWQFSDFIQPFNISAPLTLLRNKWPQRNLPKKRIHSSKSLHFSSFYYKYTPKKSTVLGYIEKHVKLRFSFYWMVTAILINFLTYLMHWLLESLVISEYKRKSYINTDRHGRQGSGPHVSRQTHEALRRWYRGLRKVAISREWRRWVGNLELKL